MVDRSELPLVVREGLQDLLDCVAEGEAVHAERAVRLALFARTASTCHLDGVSRAACARGAGVSEETLRQYAVVASWWSAIELRYLLVERRGSTGTRISISH